MSKDKFGGFGDYEESNHQDVNAYLNDEDTPIDHKMSSEDGAIATRQEKKGERGSSKGSTKSTDRSSGDTIQNKSNASKSVSQTVEEERHGKTISLEQHNKEEEKTSEQLRWERNN